MCWSQDPSMEMLPWSTQVSLAGLRALDENLGLDFGATTGQVFAGGGKHVAFLAAGRVSSFPRCLEDTSAGRCCSSSGTHIICAVPHTVVDDVGAVAAEVAQGVGLLCIRSGRRLTPRTHCLP